MEAARQVVQKKHRVAIPKEYREALGIREGDEVELRMERGRIIIRHTWAVDNLTERLSGLVKSEKPLPPRSWRRKSTGRGLGRRLDDPPHQKNLPIACQRSLGGVFPCRPGRFCALPYSQERYDLV